MKIDTADMGVDIRCTHSADIQIWIRVNYECRYRQWHHQRAKNRHTDIDTTIHTDIDRGSYKCRHRYRSRMTGSMNREVSGKKGRCGCSDMRLESYRGFPDSQAIEIHRDADGDLGIGMVLETQMQMWIKNTTQMQL